MPKAKPTPSIYRVIKRYVYSFTDSKGEEQERTHFTRVNGEAVIKPQGSVFLGFVNVVLMLGDATLVITGMIAGIRRDGRSYLCPKGENRQDSWVNREGTLCDGARWWEAPGFDAEESFFNVIADQLPELRKREKSMRAALAKRAAAA